MANLFNESSLTIDNISGNVPTTLNTINSSRRWIKVKGKKSITIHAPYLIASVMGYFTDDIIRMTTIVPSFGSYEGLLTISYSGGDSA